MHRVVVADVLARNRLGRLAARAQIRRWFVDHSQRSWAGFADPHRLGSKVFNALGVLTSHLPVVGRGFFDSRLEAKYFIASLLVDVL